MCGFAPESWSGPGRRLRREELVRRRQQFVKEVPGSKVLAMQKTVETGPGLGTGLAIGFAAAVTSLNVFNALAVASSSECSLGLRFPGWRPWGSCWSSVTD
jgi:hypothetical protein